MTTGVTPLLDPHAIRQAGLAGVMDEAPLRGRDVLHAGTKGVILRGYPVGHRQNSTGQTLYDVQPLGALPLLRKIPMAHPHAHQETETALAHSARRQPYDPKPRNRIEGSARDLRPGTFVWVQFLGGDLTEGIITGTAKFARQGAGGFPREQQAVDRIATDGAVTDTLTHPLDADVDSYPRSVDVYNGTRVEVDNRGNYHVQTTTDRTPVFPGHNGIPQSPEPEGSIGVSTRGAIRGHIVFTTGRHPRFDDEPSQGRQMRQSLGADDGTIRDETRSTLGHLIHRIRAGVGRMWSSTRGASDGRVYVEDKDRNYVALGPERAELHGEDQVVLDGDTIALGHAAAEYHAVLWEQLVDALTLLTQLFDAHVHSGVQTGSGMTAAPTTQQTPVLDAQKDTFRSEVVTLDKDPGAGPTYQDDPEDDD